jgi:hypothetical protein
LYFSRSGRDKPGSDLAQTQPDETPTPTPRRGKEKPNRDRELARKKPTPPVDPAPRRQPDESAGHNPTRIVRIPEEDRKPEEVLVPKKKRPGLLFGPKENESRFEQIDVALPAILDVHTLGRPAALQRLVEELEKARAFRIELLCPNPTRAFERVRPAFQARQINLTVDPAAQRRLEKPWKTDYALFVENVTPEELAAMLREVGTADRKASGKRPADARFGGSLVLAPLSRLDRKDLTDLLGSDPTAIRPRATGPLGVDLHRPLPDQTARQVLEALKGKGRQRKGSRESAVKVLERSALVVLYGSNRTAMPSKEVKAFLATRKPGRTGAISVLLVLRGT